MTDTSMYNVQTQPGEFTGTLDVKKWGKKTNVICFFTLDSGEKIAANVWWRQNYLGLKEIPIGSRVTLSFEISKKGNAFLGHVRQEEIDG